MKAAPRAFSDAVLDKFSARRRYKCSACGWQGRRNRLKRRTQEMPTSLSPRTAPKARAVWFALLAGLFLLASGILLMRSCNDGPHGLMEGPG
jgi:hypothetical protein